MKKLSGNSIYFFALSTVNVMVLNNYKSLRGMENLDKIYEIEINSCGIVGKVRIQNSNNRVVANILLDKLNYYRWNNAVNFLTNMTRKNEKKFNW